MKKAYGIFTKYSHSYSFLLALVLVFSMVLSACDVQSGLPTYGNMPDKTFGNAKFEVLDEGILLVFSGIMTGKAVPSPILTGDIRLVHAGGTFTGIYNAIQGKVDTVRFAKNGQYLLGWVMGEKQAAYAVIENSVSGLQKFFFQWGGKGMVMNTLTWEEFQSALVNNGWMKVASKELSPEFVKQVAVIEAGLSAVGSTIATISKGLPNVLILPMGLFDQPLGMPVSTLQ